MAQTYPYDDDYMYFDSNSKRYVLTPKCVLDKYGIDLESALSERKAVNAQIMAQAFLREVSDDIYDYIHEYNADTHRQDTLIACVPSLRKIIQTAMEKQFLYSRLNGLLGFSSVKEEQEQTVCPKAVKALGQIVPELGFSILYTGVI